MQRQGMATAATLSPTLPAVPSTDRPLPSLLNASPRSLHSPLPSSGANEASMASIGDNDAVSSSRGRPALETSSRDSSASPPISPNSINGDRVYPQFPFSVALPYIPGSNANLTGYFANAQNQPLPDDSDVQTRLPSICVDYLSHAWREDDIWASWKAMTKHKADLANGVRLENASWRTWAKQRSKLRTISPETLNWLKDSDVTWLYGPLHTAVDPVPPARAATMEDRLNLDPQTQARHAANPVTTSHHDVRARAARLTVPTKPILKYRSLSDILSVPTHRHRPFDMMDDDESSDGATASANRPPLSHTRSDTVVPGPRRVSPARPADDHSPVDVNGVNGRATPSERSAGSADDSELPRRHISFNHFVEQCIAVESDDESAPYYGSDTSVSTEDDDEDEDDEDDALSFRSSPRSHAFPLARTHTPLHIERDREPHTIAKLAPTVLKSSELVYPSPSPAVVLNGQVVTSPSVLPRAPLIAVGQQKADPANGQYPPVPPPFGDWREEEYGSLGFDYFAGNADFGVGDEYHHVAANVPNAPAVSSRKSPRGSAEGSPASSAGPASPSLPAAADFRPSGRSILKPRGAGADATSSSPPSSVTNVAGGYTSYAAAAAAPAAKSSSPPNASPASSSAQIHVPRGRSISRGSSSSSLDRSSSSDGRRVAGAASPVVVSDGERGRSSGLRIGNRSSGSTSSVSELGTSPSRVDSDATIGATQVSSASPSKALVAATSSPEDPSLVSSSSSSSLTAAHGETNLPATPPSDDIVPAVSPSKVSRSESADFERDPGLLFGSPAMPSSPVSSSSALPHSNSFSALNAVKWSDDDPSPARRALLRARARGAAATPAGGRRGSSDGALPDDFGLAYASFDDEEGGGVVSRAVEIVGTARDLVSALWTVAFRR